MNIVERFGRGDELMAADKAALRGKVLAGAIEARLRTGRPIAAERWIVEQEAALARPLRPGRKPKQRPAGVK